MEGIISYYYLVLVAGNNNNKETEHLPAHSGDAGCAGRGVCVGENPFRPPSCSASSRGGGDGPHRCDLALAWLCAKPSPGIASFKVYEQVSGL